MGKSVFKTARAVVKTDATTKQSGAGQVQQWNSNHTLISTTPLPAGSRSPELVYSNKISYERNNNRSITKNCDHRLTNELHIPINGKVITGPANYNLYDNFYPGLVNDSNNWFGLSAPPSLPGVGPASNFNSTAFVAMQPDLEAAMNLSVFLIELSDIVRLKTLFTKWNGFTRKAAEGHLNYSFGVKPFMSDVKSLWNTLANHQSILEDFMAKRNTPQVRHYTGGAVTDSGTTAKSLIGSAWKVWTKWSYTYQDFATMRYSYDCADIDSYWTFLNAMRQMLGLRFSQSVIWELIPFSFVVDWFFRVGDYLERFESSLFPVTVTVTDYLITRKVTWNVTRYVDYCSTTWQSFDSTHVWHKGQYKSYKRLRALPDSETAFINRGQYGLNQLALSASLLRVLR